MSSGVDVEALLDNAEKEQLQLKQEGDNKSSLDREARAHRVRDSSRDRRSRSRRRNDDRNRSRSPDRRNRDGDYYRGGGRYRRSRTPDDGDRYRPRGRRDRRDRSRSRARHPAGRERSPRLTQEEKDKRTVFVQQLAQRLTEREFTKFFAQAGEVRAATIVTDRVSGRSKGVGYVEFVDEESVDKALALTGKQLLRIPVIVQPPEAEKNRAARPSSSNANNNGVPFHRLYVGNIHFQMEEDDLRNIFETHGELEYCHLQKDDSGRSRGYGFVQYVNPDDAKRALEMINGMEFCRRTLRVGLGNDKFTADSTQALMHKFNGSHTQGHQGQGSNFFGAGGRGRHAGGTANFDRASGRNSNKGAGGASALDDTDVNGIGFNNYSREKLMRKLAREPSPPPTVANSAARRSGAHPTALTTPAGRHIKIQNVFDPEEENARCPDGSWVKELQDEIKEECDNQYGKVLHISLDANSDGDVYLRFEKVESGEKALHGLNGRWFGGRQLAASPVTDGLYSTLFGRPKALA